MATPSEMIFAEPPTQPSLGKPRHVRARMKREIRAIYRGVRFLRPPEFSRRYPEQAKEFLTMIMEANCRAADCLFYVHGDAVFMALLPTGVEVALYLSRP